MCYHYWELKSIALQNMTAIGIDLGTSNTCMAIWKNGRAEIIPNGDGHPTTPSMVAFCDEILIGENAKNKLKRYPTNVIYDVKYLMGRKYLDPVVTKLSNTCSYDIVCYSGKPKISINSNTELLTPEEVSAHLLKRLKLRAEQALDSKVESVVITVPSYFRDAARQATIDAGTIAGFKNVDLLNEPTAAALDYGIDNSLKKQKILIFDFGGGTFDVSILECDNNDFTVLGTDGDLNLGGNDINETLANHTISEMKKEFGKPINLDTFQMSRVNAACERAKVFLSSESQADIDLCEVKNYRDFAKIISREKFNELSKGVLEKCMDVTKRCIERAKLRKDDIDTVLLVGGSTRILDVRERITQYFGKEPKHNINPDEAVAMGAAIMAAKLHSSDFQDMNLKQLSTYSLGLETEGGKFHALIPKFSTIPTDEYSDTFHALEGSDCCTIEIFSGEEELTENNVKLGEFDVKGIPDGPKGRMIEVAFKIDRNGILKVTTVDQSGKSENMDISLDKGNLTSDELVKMKRNLEEYSASSNQNKNE